MPPHEGGRRTGVVDEDGELEDARAAREAKNKPHNQNQDRALDGAHGSALPSCTVRDACPVREGKRSGGHGHPSNDPRHNAPADDVGGLDRVSNTSRRAAQRMYSFGHGGFAGAGG
jgi:hypothetical protein